MKSIYLRSLPAALLAGVALTLAACSKDETDESAAAPAPEPVAEAAPAEAVAEAAPEPVFESAGNVEGTVAETDAALQQKNYQLAADSLIKMQISGAVQNDQQAWDYNRRMTILQGQLAEAAAGGDARAQATIEFLKRTQRRGP